MLRHQVLTQHPSRRKAAPSHLATASAIYEVIAAIGRRFASKPTKHQEQLRSHFIVNILTLNNQFSLFPLLCGYLKHKRRYPRSLLSDARPSVCSRTFLRRKSQTARASPSPPTAVSNGKAAYPSSASSASSTALDGFPTSRESSCHRQ